MGTNYAAQANDIAKASLNESQRQYSEQQAEKNAQKAAAKSNAAGNLQSANMAYANTYSTSTDFTSGRPGAFSLLTAGGTDSIIGTLLGENNTGKLGG